MFLTLLEAVSTIGSFVEKGRGPVTYWDPYTPWERLPKWARVPLAVLIVVVLVWMMYAIASYFAGVR
jgi:hypothetical protein